MAIWGYIEPSKLEREVRNKLREKGITKLDYPINPYKLIEDENITLQETPFNNENIRGMIVHGPNVSGILINSNRNENSKRFIAMHELSHHWFHPHNTQRICLEEYTQTKKGIEWQANNAAAYALMPSEILTDLYDYCSGDMDYMCTELKVSKTSLVYRLNEMELNLPYVLNLVDKPRRDMGLEALERQWLYGF